jgi:hypothetical protein
MRQWRKAATARLKGQLGAALSNGIPDRLFYVTNSTKAILYFNFILLLFSVGYTQEYKIHQIDSLGKQIKSNSHLLLKTTFDTTWHKYPDRFHIMTGRFERKTSKVKIG